MPLNRAARQAQQMRGRAPRNRTAGSWTPRVDVFGTLRLPSGAEFRARLIEYAPMKFAAFAAGAIETPALFETETDFNIKGRILTAQSEAGEVKFQKAGCGCETPQELRIGRNLLLKHVPQEALEEASEQVPVPE